MRLTPATRRGSIGARPDLQKFRRACRVFLARLLIVHGEDVPDALRLWRFTSTWTKCVGWKGRLSLLRPPGLIAAD
jgi:hypothetical protein